MPDPQIGVQILHCPDRHAFTHYIEDEPKAVEALANLKNGTLAVHVEGRYFRMIEYAAGKRRLEQVDPRAIGCPRSSLWQRFINLFRCRGLLPHLRGAVDHLGRPACLGPLPPWSRQRTRELNRSLKTWKSLWQLTEAGTSRLDKQGLWKRIGLDLRGIDRHRFATVLRHGLPMDSCNLRRAMLRGADLAGTALARAILNEADLREANLAQATCDGICLRNARMRGAMAAGASFAGADLRGADLRGADLRGADLSGAQFDGARLDGARLAGTVLSLPALLELIDAGVDVRGAKPQRHAAPMDGADPMIGSAAESGSAASGFSRDCVRKLVFAGVDLSGTDLRKLDLSGIDFGPGDRQTNLEGADLSGAQLQGARLARARLAGADLRGATLTDATLHLHGLFHVRLDRSALASLPASHRNLSRTDLAGADLRGFDFTGFYLAEANLEGADLRGADLSRAYSLTNVKLKGATVDETTRLLSAPDWKRLQRENTQRLRGLRCGVEVLATEGMPSSPGEAGRLYGLQFAVAG